MPKTAESKFASFSPPRTSVVALMFVPESNDAVECMADRLDRCLWRYETGRYHVVIVYQQFKAALDRLEERFSRLNGHRAGLLRYAVEALRAVERCLQRAHDALIHQYFRACLEAMRLAEAGFKELGLTVRAMRAVDALHQFIDRCRVQIPLDVFAALPTFRLFFSAVSDCRYFLEQAAPRATMEMVRFCRQQLKKWCQVSASMSLELTEQRLNVLRTLYLASLEWPVTIPYDERVLQNVENLLSDDPAYCDLVQEVLSDCEQEIALFQAFLDNWRSVQDVASEAHCRQLRLTLQEKLQQQSLEQAMELLQSSRLALTKGALADARVAGVSHRSAVAAE
ncbi:MAG: hypothetical protein P8104_01695 [Gammaproteobacteria bacterium]